VSDKGRYVKFWIRRLDLGLDRKPRAGLGRSTLMRLLLLLLPLSCVDSIEGGECNVDGDCNAEFPTCVYDANQAKSYCSKSCIATTDCPRDMSCRVGVIEEVSNAVEQGICIRRVRECLDTDACNGLDDDCNGVVDDPGCSLITACNDDDVCGAFVCSAPPNQPATVCTPPIATAKNYLDDCTADDQCPNGLCSTGVCSPFCRARSDNANECDGSTVCARSMGARSRPPHNICQIPCDSPSDCDGDTECVWRDIHEPRDVDHVAVCSFIDPERLPLGSFCPNFSVESDDMCQYGLCFQQACTRICGGPNTDCSDVGPDFECEVVELSYGTLTHVHNVCRRP